MANKIVLKKSSVPAKVPTSGDLDYGELALNYYDGRLYYKTSSNTISYFDSLATATDSFKTISVNGQSDIIASSPQSVLYIVAGNGVSITTDSENSSLTISSQEANAVTLAVELRSGFITTKLTSLLQTFLRYDNVSFRDNKATVLTRSGSVAVIA